MTYKSAGTTLIGNFPITLPNGQKCEGELHRTARTKGRRIIVRDDKSVVFDTNDAYDYGNVINALERWVMGLQEAERLRKLALKETI